MSYLDMTCEISDGMWHLSQKMTWLCQGFFFPLFPTPDASRKEVFVHSSPRQGRNPLHLPTWVIWNLEEEQQGRCCKFSLTPVNYVGVGSSQSEHTILNLKKTQELVAETNGKAENIREPCATSLFFSEGKVLLEGVQKGAEEENEDMDKKP